MSKKKRAKLTKFTFEIKVRLEALADSCAEAEQLAQDSVLSGSNGTDASIMETELVDEEEVSC